MNDVQSTVPVMRFGAFEVKINSRELRKHGMRIRLEEKPFQILEMLLEDAGQVVTRKALRPRFVETLPRLGYRFIAPVIGPGRAAVADKKMLLVLPFESLCGDDEQEFFADGLTEEMISQLGQLNPKRLGVIARTSAVQYKARKKSIGEIAAELRVDCVLEGSVRCNGQRMRITGQLIETRDQTHLWSATYDRDLRDALEVQAEVARQIGKALAPQLLAD